MSLFRELDDHDGEWGSAAQVRAEWDGERETHHQAGRVRRAFVLSVLLLILFHSSALVSLARDLPVGPVEDGIVALAETWHGQMKKNGFTDPGTRVRDWVSELRTIDWTEIGVWLNGKRETDRIAGPQERV